MSDQTEPSSASEEGVSQSGADHAAVQNAPEFEDQLKSARSQLRERFGHMAMAMMLMPRYKHLTLADLHSMLLDPLMRDRVAVAFPASTESGSPPIGLDDTVGMALWASVSEDVDTKIRDQIKAGTFPVRLVGDDWASGEINWLMDIIAPDRKSTANVVANFQQVTKGNVLRLHPIINRLVDEDVLAKMGAQKLS